MRLAEPVWRERKAAHEERADALVAAPLARRSRGETDPVEDFLFTYYSLRPGRLRRWSPGPGVVLEGAPVEKGWVAVDGGAVLGPPSTSVRRTASRVAELLAATASRPPQLACFGLHEWAMVHGSDQVRHSSVPLRLGAAGTDAVVESLPLRCTHHDAYRFFTPSAAPLNSLVPTADTRVAHEQPGCLHAGMDLYRMAWWLHPHVASELVLDAFVLARRLRELDMRASPYDLADRGLLPVRIETADGRREYAGAQAALAREAAPVRARVLEAARSLTPTESPAL